MLQPAYRQIRHISQQVKRQFSVGMLLDIARQMNDTVIYALGRIEQTGGELFDNSLESRCVC